MCLPAFPHRGTTWGTKLPQSPSVPPLLPSWVGQTPVQVVARDRWKEGQGRKRCFYPAMWCFPLGRHLQKKEKVRGPAGRTAVWSSAAKLRVHRGSAGLCVAASSLRCHRGHRPGRPERDTSEQRRQDRQGCQEWPLAQDPYGHGSLGQANVSELTRLRRHWTVDGEQAEHWPCTWVAPGAHRVLQHSKTVVP